MKITRRTAIAAGIAAASPWTQRAWAQNTESGPFKAPPLPYALNALEPHLSERAMGLHVEIHQQAAERLNALVAGTDYAALELENLIVTAADEKQWEIYDPAAQLWNHTFFFEQFRGGASLPGPVLEEALAREFGGLAGLAEVVLEAAAGVFGGGWVWLMAEGDGLFLQGVSDAVNPLGTDRQVLMGVDLWEHAYVIDYGTRQAEYLQAVVLSLTNWEAIDQRFMDG
ncbi:MAG: Fe-Mn family superoxide dismutase [Pseudomonadota bacterium]